MALQVLHGDMREVLATMDADSVHSIVTDPPYELAFMGRAWDQTGIAFRPDTWRSVLRVLKPGGHLAVFGGTRTFARLFVAVEDAGFEHRDTCSWNYGSGFPKSRNLDGDWHGWGTALKPAWEPIGLFRKPLSEATVAANMLRHGTGALNINACRVECAAGDKGEWPITARAADRGSMAGPMNAAPTDQTTGRWPANVLHDGSDEVEAAFAVFGSAGGGYGKRGAGGQNGIYSPIGGTMQEVGFGDSGTASRFFYSAKADAADRAGSKHPTVKPVALMRWLVRLITPPGGAVLDPFAGSGTTGEAAMLENMHALLIEQDAHHVADIEHRQTRWSGGDLPLFSSADAHVPPLRDLFTEAAD